MKPKSRRSTHASALIIVLASLIFLSAIVVAFMMSMRSKLAISKSGADAMTVRMLSETAVNVVISQVRDATQRAGSNRMAWASQPGMIRLYNDTGVASGYYKLYSADNLVGTGAFDSKRSALAGEWTGWNAQPEVFTDLNAPIRGIFPILDYNAAVSLGVQGLSLNGTIPGAMAGNPVPMPVKWLYVLADGSLHTATASDAGAVVAAATAQNPIVGRVAFWTDDETCKVNVNTASEGLFWSTPRFTTEDEQKLARYQPARGEFQRYPGHPATVSLSAIFPTLTAKQIFEIAPRLSWGGSENGTIKVDDVSTWVHTDRDRLYDSVDEALFTINRTLQGGLGRDMVKAGGFFLTASSRAPELNLFGLPRVATWPLHEVNDTNYRTTNDRLIAFSSTINGSFTPPATFYFTRENNVDPDHDINLPRNHELLNYLDRLTGLAIPGFGGSFRDKYTQKETRQILTEIFDYIRSTNLLDLTTPAVNDPTETGRKNFPYAYALSSRYHDTHPGSLDYGRGVSLGTVAPAYHADWDTRGFGGRFMQIRAAHLHFVAMGQGNQTANGTVAVPIQASQKGLRIGGIVDDIPPEDTVAVQAFLYLSLLTPSEGITKWSPGHWIEIEGLENLQIKLPDGNYTAMGFPANGTMTVMGNMLGGGGVAGARIASLEPWAFVTGINRPKSLDRNSAHPDEEQYWFPFYSSIFPVSTNATTSNGTLDFKSNNSTLTIRLYADAPQQGSTPPFQKGKLIQEFHLQFPDGIFPRPKFQGAPSPLVGSGYTDGSGGEPIVAHEERWWFDDAPYRKYRMFDPDHDVLRTVELDRVGIKGDIRMLTGPEPVGTFYAPSANYNGTAQFDIPIQKDRYILQRDGVLVSGAIHYTDGGDGNKYPFVPNGTAGGSLWDWDNGTSLTPDGPFINATDPGSIPSTAEGNVYQESYFSNTNLTSSDNPDIFSPNRQMPGPGMFGSLSTGVQRGIPWQTLLFRPGPAGHVGSTAPKDHLLLDLFWMPIVEPYAISEPFSTAGKINMNQQIVPFAYIERFSGLHAAMQAERIARASKSNANNVKNPNIQSVSTRVGVNLDPSNGSLSSNGSLRQFREKFNGGEIFKSATEICDIFLVPQGDTRWTSDARARLYWYGTDFSMVGDNTRERPYVHLYNKLTTKSNTYTVHYRVQVLARSAVRNQTNPTNFDPAQGDRVAAEQRGSTTFERYLDQADITADPARSGASSLEADYRTRIIHSTQFNP